MKKTQRLTAVFLLLLILCGCSKPTAPDTIVMPQTSAGNPHRTRACFSRTGTRRVSSGIRADRAAGAAFGRHGADRAGRHVPSRRRFGDGACARAPDGGGKKRRTPASGQHGVSLRALPGWGRRAWLLCGSLPKGYFDAFGNFRFLSKEPEGKFALAHYDAAFALQEIVLLQTQYTDRFFQLCRLEGGFCMMSASLLIRLDEAGAETSRQSLDAKDGWSFAAIQEADGVLYVLTRNFYGEELPELRKFAPDTLSALEADTCTSEVIGLGLCADGRLLMGNREELFAYDTGSGETEPLVRWQELGANVLTEQPRELEDGYLLFSPGDTSLQRLRRVPDRRRSGRF